MEGNEMIVAISGVSGVGKTTVSRILQKKLKWELVRPDEIAKKKRLYLGYDKKRKSLVVDLNRLKKEINKIAAKEDNVIIESLYAHFFDADLVIVLRCSPEILEKRLKRKYTWHTKITENKEAEMMGLISQEAVRKFGRGRVFELDTTASKPALTAARILRLLKNQTDKSKYSVGWIDWLDKF